VGPGIMEPPGPAIVAGRVNVSLPKTTWPWYVAKLVSAVIVIVELAWIVAPDAMSTLSPALSETDESWDWMVAPELSASASPATGARANDEGTCRSTGPGAVMFALTVTGLPFPSIVAPARTAATLPPEVDPGLAVAAMVNVSGAVGVGAFCTVQVPLYAAGVTPEIVTDWPWVKPVAADVVIVQALPLAVIDDML
jgi:hypothetical protein